MDRLKAVEFYTPPSSGHDRVQDLIDQGYISANDMFAPERVLRPTSKGVGRVMRELIPVTDRDKAVQIAERWEALVGDRLDTFHKYHSKGTK